jgi:Electron transfer DM13
VRTARSTSLGPKALAGIATAALTAAGVWVAGGLITNDFGLAMGLTTAWLVLAGLACVGIALRRRGLAVPVLGAYLLTAGAIGIYLGRSMFIDDTVDERVVRVDPAPNRSAPGSSSAQPRDVELGRGAFAPVAHSVRGTATTIRAAEGPRVLTLTGFEVDNGPDLRVYLVAGPARNESEVDDFRDLGALKGNKGDQQYDLPRGLDLDRYTTVVIWCRAFSVNFARAPLR